MHSKRDYVKNGTTIISTGGLEVFRFIQQVLSVTFLTIFSFPRLIYRVFPQYTKLQYCHQRLFKNVQGAKKSYSSGIWSSNLLFANFVLLKTWMPNWEERHQKCSSGVSVVLEQGLTYVVVDPVFTRGIGEVGYINPEGGGALTCYLTNYPEHYMKMAKISSRGTS